MTFPQRYLALRTASLYCVPTCLPQWSSHGNGGTLRHSTSFGKIQPALPRTWDLSRNFNECSCELLWAIATERLMREVGYLAWYSARGRGRAEYCPQEPVEPSGRGPSCCSNSRPPQGHEHYQLTQTLKGPRGPPFSASFRNSMRDRPGSRCFPLNLAL